MVLFHPKFMTTAMTGFEKANFPFLYGYVLRRAYMECAFRNPLSLLVMGMALMLEINV